MKAIMTRKSPKNQKPAGKKPFDAVVAEDARNAVESRTAASDEISLRVDPDAARALFYNRASPEEAAWASAQLCPEPIAPNIVPLTVSAERWGRLLRAYVECLDDRTLPIGLQRAMHAALPCDPVVTLDSDHSPFLCAPRVLAVHLGNIASIIPFRLSLAGSVTSAAKMICASLGHPASFPPLLFPGEF